MDVKEAIIQFNRGHIEIDKTIELSLKALGSREEETKAVFHILSSHDLDVYDNEQAQYVSDDLIRLETDIGQYLCQLATEAFQLSRDGSLSAEKHSILLHAILKRLSREYEFIRQWLEVVLEEEGYF